MAESYLALVESDEFVRVVFFDIVLGLYAAPVASHDFVGVVSIIVAVHVHYFYSPLLFLVRCLLDELLQQRKVRIVIQIILSLLHGLSNNWRRMFFCNNMGRLLLGNNARRLFLWLGEVLIELYFLVGLHCWLPCSF